MTEKEKSIYNLYLQVSRSSQNQPFQYRKNFDNFEKDQNYPYLQKVVTFFNNFKQIDPEIYFKAPHKLYPDEKFFGLNFFITQKAIKTYSLYMKLLQAQSPDAPEQIEHILKSLRYIADYCMWEKIPVEDYIKYKKGITYIWMQHLKDHKINIYSLLEYNNLYDIIYSVPQDEREMFLGDIATNFYSFKNQYNNSDKAKNIVKKGFEIITKFVKNNIVINK